MRDDVQPKGADRVRHEDEDEAPAPGQQPMEWGSDAVAELIGRLDLPYLSFTPGASYRGLHDSLVNYAHGSGPKMILCLHEEHAVAVAHGYAKVAGRPMAVALHSNVGLMHATMALFNAYCDRMPMVVIGATGPVDATARRPWIEWIHTAADQGALIRNYCKWDDQPGSVQAALESVVRADQLTRAYPSAPTYVCLDVSIQEERLAEPATIPDPALHRPPRPPAPPRDSVAEVVAALGAARHPLILMGRVGRGEKQWTERVALAERAQAVVLTDLKVGAVFPTDHELHPAGIGTRLTPEANELLARADVVLSLDWIDLGGTLTLCGPRDPSQRVLSCSLDHTLHNGWSKDHFALPPVELSIGAHPDLLVEELLARLPRESSSSFDPDWPATAREPDATALTPEPGELLMAELVATLGDAVEGHEVCLTGVPLGWPGTGITFRSPLDYLGREAGGGVGAGPGIAVGAALALAGTGRMPVAVVGDGDFLMGASALWTAAHHRLPLLVVVANNRSYFNDEVHQEQMALTRQRPVENKGIGLHLRDPDPDLATLARSLGLIGYGPVGDSDELAKVLPRAVEQAEGGQAVVVDVRVSHLGYKRASRPARQTTA